MREGNRAVIDGAMIIARETDADAVLLAAALPEETRYLEETIGSERRVIAASPGHESGGAPDGDIIALPEVRLRRRGRAKIALMEGLAAGLLNPGEKVVVISGSGTPEGCALDTVALVDLDKTDDDLLEGEVGAPLPLLRGVADPAVFDAVLGLCLELAKEGKEGKPVGLLVTLGDHDRVLERSRQLVLNPFEGHAEDDRSVLSPAARRAVREFSGMDGAFVLRSDGVIEAAGRYLADLASDHELPGGLGARHRAGAGITGETRALAFVISESTGDTRVFAGGRIIMTVEKTD
ncbi:MAG TPA: diadenylate cyclase [Longimicrobiales bacterium]